MDVIRKARKEDLANFLKLKKEFMKEYGIRQQSAQFLRREFLDFLRHILVLAEANHKLVAYLAGIIEKNRYETYGYIEEIFVLKDMRKHGVATRLKDNYLNILKSEGIALCKLDVSPTNQAKSLYKKWGFKVKKIQMVQSVLDA